MLTPMHLPNREQWKFVATPRELQFFVVGIAVGVALLATLKALSVPAEGVLFVVGVPAAAAMFFLAAVRSNP